MTLTLTAASAAALTLTAASAAALTLTAPTAQTVRTAVNYTAAILADTPVCYLRMGSTGLTDLSGNANNGTANGGLTDVAGAIQDNDLAYQLNGTTGYVSVAHATSLNTGDTMSFECWLKHAAGASQTIFFKGATFLQLSVYSNQIEAYMNGSSVAHGTTLLTVDGLWHHIVLTKTGATVKIYLDATDITSAVVNQTIVNTSATLSIGQAIGFAQFVTGSLDEVAMYATALSAARVSAHYAAASVATTTYTPVLTAA